MYLQHVRAFKAGIGPLCFSCKIDKSLITYPYTMYPNNLYTRMSCVSKHSVIYNSIISSKYSSHSNLGIFTSYWSFNSLYILYNTSTNVLAIGLRKIVPIFKKAYSTGFTNSICHFPSSNSSCVSSRITEKNNICMF